MLQKASADDVAALQAYTIQSLDQQGSVMMDVENTRCKMLKMIVVNHYRPNRVYKPAATTYINNLTRVQANIVPN